MKSAFLLRPDTQLFFVEKYFANYLTFLKNESKHAFQLFNFQPIN